MNALIDWQPIDTAPKDNKRPLLVALFVDGQLQAIDWDAKWERVECRSLYGEFDADYWVWTSPCKNVRHPTHWALQPDSFARVSHA